MATQTNNPPVFPPASQADEGAIGAGHPAKPMVLPASVGGKTTRTTSSLSGERNLNSK